MKEKVEELEKQIKQMKRVDSLDNVNVNDLCIHPALNFLKKF